MLPTPLTAVGRVCIHEDEWIEVGFSPKMSINELPTFCTVSEIIILLLGEGVGVLSESHNTPLH